MTGRVKIETNVDLCRDCQACALGCSLLHEAECNLGLARLAIIKDFAKYEFNILICQHCEHPDCVDVCPSDAIVLDDRGVALLLDNECIRCGACAEACPYDAIFFDAASDRYLKCDLCAERQEGPLCVQLCPVGALTLVQTEIVTVEG